MLQRIVCTVFFLIFGLIATIEASDDCEVSRLRHIPSQGLEEPDFQKRVVAKGQGFIEAEDPQNKRTWVRTGGEILLLTGAMAATMYGVFFVCALYLAAQLASNMSGGHADTFEIFTELLKDFFF